MSVLQRRGRSIAVAVALLAASCGGPVDAPVAMPYAPFVESARESLARNQDGIVRSTLAYRSMRCREDGGLLLLFEQFGGFGSQGTAVAMSGPAPKDSGSWSGGFGPVDPATDLEVSAFFEVSPEVDCA